MKFRDLTRNHKLAARRAADFGADKPFANSGDYWDEQQCWWFTDWLRGRGFLSNKLVTVETTARGVSSTLDGAELLLKRFGLWWGHRNRILTPVPNPDQAEPARQAGPDWLDYFVVATGEGTIRRRLAGLVDLKHSALRHPEPTKTEIQGGGSFRKNLEAPAKTRIGQFFPLPMGFGTNLYRDRFGESSVTRARLANPPDAGRDGDDAPAEASSLPTVD